MPGLRHAHTLQQLRDLFEYSPPGEYLKQIKKIHHITIPQNNDITKSKEIINNITKKVMCVYS